MTPEGKRAFSVFAVQVLLCGKRQGGNHQSCAVLVSPLQPPSRARSNIVVRTSDRECVVSASGENCAFQFLWCKSGYVTIGLSISLL